MRVRRRLLVAVDAQVIPNHFLVRDADDDASIMHQYAMRLFRERKRIVEMLDDFRRDECRERTAAEWEPMRICRDKEMIRAIACLQSFQVLHRDVARDDGAVGAFEPLRQPSIP